MAGPSGQPELSPAQHQQALTGPSLHSMHTDLQPGHAGGTRFSTLLLWYPTGLWFLGSDPHTALLALTW